MHSSKRQDKSGERSAGQELAMRRYSFLASWSNAAGYKKAAWTFTVKLCWAEIFRTEKSRVIWDSRAEMSGVGCDSVF